MRLLLDSHVLVWFATAHRALLAHVVCAAELPAHHRDPFDRLLVAQARTERLTLVTADGAIERYDVPILRARA